MSAITHLTLRETRTVYEGGYRYIPSVFQFSGGVAAEPGHRFERIVFRTPVPLEAGFAYLETRLASLDRPMAAMCAFELRSPGQFKEDEFRRFNREYTRVLTSWGLMDGDINPVARTNVVPSEHRPEVPSIQAAVYALPERGTGGTDFVTAGGAEAPEGAGDYHAGIVRLGDTTLEGLRAKLAYVRDEQTVRLRSLGSSWDRATEVNAYCMYDVGPLVYDELISRGAAAPPRRRNAAQSQPAGG